MKTAEALFQLLKHYGVEKIFGIPGDELVIFDALAHSNIEFITSRHEQGAAFMAQAQGRTTNIPGVCISTLGPGATNLLTGVADSFQSRVPMIVLSGQLEKNQHNKIPLRHQYIDLEKLFLPITKAQFKVSSPKSLETTLSRAFTVAMTHRRGPVHLTLPVDVMEQDYTFNSNFVKPKEKLASPQPRSILRASRMIRDSKFPVAFLGQEAHNCSPLFVSALEMAHIPVMTSFSGKGSFPEKSTLSLGTVSRHIKDKLVEVIKKADLFVVINYDFIEGVSPNIFKNKKLVNLDVISHKVESILKPDLEVVGDLSTISEFIAKDLADTGFKTLWSEKFIGRIRNERYTQLLSVQKLGTFPFNPYEVLSALQKLADGNEVIVSDVGNHKQALGLGFKVESPHSIYFSNGLSSMGFSLPFSSGLRFSVPKNKKIISINGDGGFLMNFQELETIKRYNLDVKIIVFVDNAYGMIKSNLLAKYKRVNMLDFGNPDFKYLAKSFGLKYISLKSKEQLDNALKNLLSSEGPALLSVPIRYS